MLVVIHGGEVFAPDPIGVQSLLIANGAIDRVGPVDGAAIRRAGAPCEILDATDCVVVPGLVDPHGHLLGGSGEGSLALQTPMILVEEIARAGVTTVVGTLGVDTTMKTPSGLLARVKALTELGLHARMWTGGYNVPPSTLFGSVREDMMFIDEVIGAGEIAISDERGLNQSSQELAKLVRDVHVGGLLTGKAGLTHFHVGDEDTRLEPLREIIEQFQVKPEWLYPTHVERSEELFAEAVALAHEGSFVDIDCVEEDTARWVRKFLDAGGPIHKLTVSSDMDSNTPDVFYRMFCELVVEHRVPLEMALRFFSANAACALKLEKKGRIAEGAEADVLVLDRATMEIRDVIAGGKFLVRDGEVLVREKWLEKSKRKVAIVGDQS